MREERTALLYALAHFTNDLGFTGLPVFLPIWTALFGLTYTDGGILLGLTRLLAMFQLVFGYVVDRWPRRWLGPLGMLVSSLALSLTGVAPSFTLLILIVGVAALGSALFHPASVATVSNPKSTRRATLVSLFSSGGVVGFATGPLIFLAIAHTIGLQGTLLLALLGGPIFLGLLRYGVPPSPTTPLAVGEVAQALRARWRTFLPLVLALLVSSVTVSALGAYLPSYGVAQGLELTLAGLLLFAYIMPQTFGSLLLGQITDRVGRRLPVAAYMAVSTPILLAFIHGPLQLIWPAIALAGFTLAATFPILVVMMQELLPENRALASAMAYALHIGLGGLGVAITGVALDLYGFTPTLQALALLPLAAAATVLALPPSRPKAPIGPLPESQG
jgi:FSR family fosmidomycin resistance protein-like MFS transporter